MLAASWTKEIKKTSCPLLVSALSLDFRLLKRVATAIIFRTSAVSVRALW